MAQTAQTTKKIRTRIISSSQSNHLKPPNLKSCKFVDIRFEAPTSEAVSIKNLKPKHCRWPLWQAVDEFSIDKMIYCGCQRLSLEQGRPYCARHTAAAKAIPSKQYRKLMRDKAKSQA